MKKSDLIRLLQADLEANGDTEHVALGFIIAKDGQSRRFDAYGEIQISNDPNFANGMAYLVSDTIDSATIRNFLNEGLSEKQQVARGSLLAEVFKLRKDSEHKDRFQSTWGSKTPMGVFAVAKRIVEEGQ